ITVHTPTDTAPGEYKGVLTVQSREPADKISLPVSVKVWNFEIPQKLNLPTDAGLRVTTLAEFFYGKAGYKDPEKYISASEYRKFLKFLLRYRLTPKPFIYTGQHLAWVPYLKWQLRKDKLTIDFTEYDKNVKLILDNGGNVVYAGNLPAFFASAAKTKVRLIKEFIPLMYEHLKQKGWNDIAYFYGFDEPKGSKVEAVKKEMALSGKLAPGVKRMVVYGSKDFVRKIFAESKLGEYIDIWVPHRHQLFDRKFIRQLQSRGETVWAYDSGGPTYDIFSKNIEKRIFLWILRKYKLKGFVIWATTRCWGNLADIKEDGTPEKSWKTGSGDGYYAYPAGKKLENGLNPSIRLEVMRDGFEDWEYFRLLEAKLKELKNRNKGNRYQALIKKTEKLLTIDDQLVKDSRTYTNNPQKLLAKRIELAGQIEKFNRVLKSNKLKITK
ncbi:MAG: glycoside hydrolase domain-containing protein, partial [Victivallales bacterium]